MLKRIVLESGWNRRPEIEVLSGIRMKPHNERYVPTSEEAEAAGEGEVGRKMARGSSATMSPLPSLYARPRPHSPRATIRSTNADISSFPNNTARCVCVSPRRTGGGTVQRGWAGEPSVTSVNCSDVPGSRIQVTRRRARRATPGRGGMQARRGAGGGARLTQAAGPRSNEQARHCAGVTRARRPAPRRRASARHRRHDIPPRAPPHPRAVRELPVRIVHGDVRDRGHARQDRGQRPGAFPREARALHLEAAERRDERYDGDGECVLGGEGEGAGVEMRGGDGVVGQEGEERKPAKARVRAPEVAPREAREDEIQQFGGRRSIGAVSL
ncbi:hypothetical protein FB451DRAFT_1443408 [Mycena latifolia]|nr:hypothetical protein FB451DRAFT_1443408 [Mycena latifolia]